MPFCLFMHLNISTARLSLSTKETVVNQVGGVPACLAFSPSGSKSR